MYKSFIDGWKSILLLVGFITLSFWCVSLSTYSEKESLERYMFGATYGLVALWGGVNGLIIAHKWGGWDSAIGRAIKLLSAGLLAQEFGQLVFSYYNIFLHEPVPYPSLADIGFFGNIPFYILGMLYLGKAAGVKYSFDRITSKIQIVCIPLVGLVISYFFFLQGYSVNATDPLRTFLDFGYPLGQSFYISLATLVYILSRNVLGGVMKNKILLLLIAFIAQYVADYNFLFQSSRGTWTNGGYGDFLYLVAYFVMALGIFQLENVFEALKRRKK